MINILSKYPSKLLTRTFLIAGLIVFIPLYSYILRVFSGMEINSAAFINILLSFDVIKFKEFCQQLNQQGHLQNFIFCYKLNALSVIGFMLAFFSISLIIARHINPSSRLYKLAFVFSIVILIIAFLDLISTAILLSASPDLARMSNWMIYSISVSYIIRIILLYIISIWIVSAMIYFILRKLRKQK